MSKNTELDALYARLDDLLARADRGELCMSGFLSPAELHYARKYLGEKCIAFGGYDEAERQRIYLLPEYLCALTEARQLFEYGFSTGVCALSLVTDGYRRLSHRDYLGSLLGLGIERTVIGDILVCSDAGDSAVVFCDETISGFICEELSRISSEKVKVGRVALDEVHIPERRYSEISDTVASPRLDCVVAAVCSLSRDKARAAVEGGLVELDFECEERADRAIVAPCMLSVRGHGRFIIDSVNDKTKKGRYRLLARKYL